MIMGVAKGCITVADDGGGFALANDDASARIVGFGETWGRHEHGMAPQAPFDEGLDAFNTNPCRKVIS